jgi:hypothetical protein
MWFRASVSWFRSCFVLSVNEQGAPRWDSAIIAAGQHHPFRFRTVFNFFMRQLGSHLLIIFKINTRRVPCIAAYISTIIQIIGTYIFNISLICSLFLLNRSLSLCILRYLGCFQHIPDADSHHRYGHASVRHFQQTLDVDPYNLIFPPVLHPHAQSYALSLLLPHHHAWGPPRSMLCAAGSGMCWKQS